ncbi:MAG: alginate export family protein, partial [Planctomycetes bacterium]|nr:alginate export family protein [Planctomycetota bacterium]
HYRVQDGDDTQFAGGRAGRDDNRTFTGVYNAVTLSPEEKGTQYLCDQFAFINRDRRRLFLPESGTHAGAMTSNTYGLRFGGKLAWGPHWDAEGAVQTGQWARDDLRAHTYHLEVGHVLVDMYGKPDLFLGYSFATGDHNAADGQRNTPDSLYPTSHIFYGSADRFLLQNLVEWQVAAAMTPWEEAANARSLGVKLSYHQFNLQNNADFIYLASGARFNAAPTRIPGNQIATELDLLTTFKLNGAVGIELGVAHLWPGEYVRHLIKSGGGAAPAGRGADRQMFSYLQVTAGF